MPARQIISMLALSALIALPVGVAEAGDIDVRNGRSRVTIKNGLIRVRRNGKTTYVSPRNNRRYRSRRWRNRPRYRTGRWRNNRYNRYRLRRSSRKPTFSCKGKGRTYKNTVRRGSRGNYTYSSVRTTSCQR